METEIVFCERCGVSIPENEVTRGRQASGGRDLCPTCLVPSGEASGDLQLYFCENCRVSIAVPDVLTGTARPEGSGYLCTVCSRSTPAERVARRTAVDREMDGLAPGAPAAAGPGTGATPLYFCDACNASIPPAVVAGGRALVHGGRTYCERCRPRLESEHPRAQPSVGALPVLAAALLAASTTAAGFVLWQRWTEDQAAGRAAVPAKDATAEIQREVRQAREAAENARELSDRADRSIKDIERKLDAIRAEAQAARLGAEKAMSMAAVNAESGERLGRVERTTMDIEDSIRLLREEMAAIAARPSGAPTAAAAGGGDGGGAKPGPEAGPDPMGGGGAPAAPAPAVPSPEVQRCVAMLKDKDAGVRFSAAIELGKLSDRSAWPALAETLRKDDDPFVRRACARSLGELKAYDAFPDLVDALTDGEEYVAIQSSRVIKEMAGQDFGFKQNQAKADRRRVADRAKKWWEENKDRLAPGARGE